MTTTQTLTWNKDSQGDPPDHFTGRVDYATRSGHISHFYLYQGQQVDGVTSIVKGGLPTPKGLQIFKERQIAQAAIDQRAFISRMEPDKAVKHLQGHGERELNKASARGTTVHDWAEQFALTGELPVLEDNHPLAGRLESLRSFLLDWQPRFVLTEVVVFNNYHLYAGTLDAIVQVDGCNWLIDYKTSARAQPEHALQLSAYRYASVYQAGVDDFRGLPRIDDTAIVLLGENGYEVRPVVADRQTFGVFLRAKSIFDFQKHASSLVGRKLPTPTRGEGS